MPIFAPKIGLTRSVKKHNCNDGIIADWIELSCLIEGEPFSDEQLVDFLIENHFYSDTIFCSEFSDQVFELLESRLSLPNNEGTFAISRGRIDPAKAVEDVPVHAFLLVLSIYHAYDKWTTEFGSDYSEQGELFEKVTEESVNHRFSQWTVTRTGWSAGNPKKLTTLLPEIASEIGESLQNLSELGIENDSDAGLDVYWHRPMADGRGGHPIYLAQCASGHNWKLKLGTPDIDTWNGFINFRHRPSTAFALPNSLTRSEFNNSSNTVRGLVLDRYRLINLGIPESDWVSDSLRSELKTWIVPKFEWLIANAEIA